MQLREERQHRHGLHQQELRGDAKAESVLGDRAEHEQLLLGLCRDGFLVERSRGQHTHGFARVGPGIVEAEQLQNRAKLYANPGARGASIT